MSFVTADRLPGAERREAILVASLHLFAKHGLHGVTTRQIAEAAGVSEALLYRHFASKDELFAELQKQCLEDTMRVADRLAALAPSTSTLVLAVYFMVHHICGRPGIGAERLQSVRRLMLGSLKDDGHFARGFLKQNLVRFLPKLVECLQAAAKAGDLIDKPRRPQLRVYFTHHVAAMLGNMQLPDPPVLDYGVDGEVLLEEAVRFGLRGLGLRPEAIDRHFNPGALALLVQGFSEK
jgi:AcrR family transcriptional regulator